VLSSLSRLQTHLVNNEHLAGCQAIRNMLSTYKENEDIITIGAYQRGSNLNVDRAIAFQPAIHQFLAQHARDVAPWKATVDSLNDLARQSQAPVQNIPPAKPANAPAAEANRTA
jgi:flagellum-specific ATP synthase